MAQVKFQLGLFVALGRLGG